jgi:pimeloyl-ACP methyl ester carboxylesterase
VAALLAMVVAALAACGTDTPTTATAASSSSAPVTSSTPAASAPWRQLDGPLARCGPQPPAVAAAAPRAAMLHDPRVGRIPAVRLGRGAVGAVLLHQTDGGGLCGWLSFMPALADAGVAVLAIDLCRYGEATCRKVEDGTFTAADQTEAVALAVKQVRRDRAIERVVVVGASMGGSVALMSGASVPGVDAVVDLSGPVDWPGVDTVRGGRALRVPALVAVATEEGAAEVAASREIAANAPQGSEFVEVAAGHGYRLVADGEGRTLDLGARVLDWITGRR